MTVLFGAEVEAVFASCTFVFFLWTNPSIVSVPYVRSYLSPPEPDPILAVISLRSIIRSEERRVGKEC